MSALGGTNGSGGPGGLFLLDCDSFDPLGAWEVDRGPQRFAYDCWWHLGYDTVLTSEWGTPDMSEFGVVPEKLLAREYGHAMHVFDLRKRRHVAALELGDAHQMVLELRPAHDRVERVRGVDPIWDRQFYPEGLDGFIAKFDVGPDGGMTLDPEFLMSSAHGAGLMLLPIVAGASFGFDGHDGVPAGLGTAALAAGVHTAAMVAVGGAIALAVFRVWGVGMLRRAWINVDRLWAVGLLAAAGVTLLVV